MGKTRPWSMVDIPHTMGHGVGHFAWPRHQTEMCLAFPEASCGWRNCVMPKWVTNENGGGNIPFLSIFLLFLSFYLSYLSILLIYLSFFPPICLSIRIYFSLFFFSLSLSLFVFKCIYIHTCIWWCVILWCMMCEKCCIVENINLGEKVPSKSLYIYTLW